MSSQVKWKITIFKKKTTKNIQKKVANIYDIAIITTLSNGTITVKRIPR